MKSLVNRFRVGLKQFRHKKLKGLYLKQPKEKEFEVVQRTINKIIAQIMQKKQKNTPKQMQILWHLTSHAEIKNVARIAWDVAQLVTLSKYAGAQAERC